MIILKFYLQKLLASLFINNISHSEYWNKNMKRKLLLCLLPFFLLLIAFSVKAMPTYSDASKTITIAKGTTEFMIQLRANPTTGYSWFLQYFDHKLLQATDHQYIPNQPKLMGSGGVTQWVFKVKSSAFNTTQTTKIKFLYARPWNMKEGASGAVFTVVMH
jgi:inhibitor of cysteine peptidase